MGSHALLVLPSANRVYTNAAPDLATAELAVLNDLALGGRLTDIGVERLGGVPYLTFAGDLAATELAVVSNLSCAYALFERDGRRLTPLDLGGLDRWDDDLLTIQRYSGKTNEQFTKLLVNMALVAGHGAAAFTGARLRVLDPLCGRGTTLNQVVMYGFDACGVELDGNDVDAYLTFFSTWLKAKRAKHHIDRQRIGRDGQRATITLSPTKADAPQEVVVIAADTTRVVEHLGKSSVDALVADLPYGVRHGSRAGARLDRRPADLLSAALPAWRAVLKPGAGVALAFNVHTLAAGALREAVQAAGLEVVAAPSFAHQVDQSIRREVLIARRPGGPARPVRSAPTG